MIIDLGGTVRETTPRQTLDKLEPLLLETFGITRVADVTGLDHIGIPVSICIRPNSKILSTSQGKGISRELADISAIMESLEAWHAENMPPPDLTGSYNALSKQHQIPAIDSLLKGHVCYQDVCDRTLAWIKTRNLIDGRDVLLPYSMLSLDSTVDRGGQELFSSTSNGLAAGNTYEEALCHGLYEIIERDCLYEKELYDSTEQEKHRVDISTIDSPHNIELIERLAASGLELYVWEITNHIGVSTFYAEIDDSRELRGLGLFYGVGTHLSKEVALSRAITEAVQSRLTIISGTRDDIFPGFYTNNENRHGSYSEHTPINYQDCTNTTIPASFSACVDVLINKLRQQNIDTVCVYDHTRPEIGVSVVHVFAPQLRFNSHAHKMVM